MCHQWKVKELRVLVAGGTGAVGQPIVAMLRDSGHVPVVTTRTYEKAELLTLSGAAAIVMNPLDSESVVAAVRVSEPDAIIHQLTALQSVKLRAFDRSLAETNSLRREGTDNLVRAAIDHGVSRIVAQSFGGWIYRRNSGRIMTEADPLDDRPPDSRETLGAILHLEGTVTATPGIEGVALRYGFFYGPGTGLGPGGAITKLIQKHRFPIIGNGAGVWSMVHIADAASAAVTALEGPPGVYNVADDEPAPVSEWLPYLAQQLGAKPPRRLSPAIARVVAGARAESMMTSISGFSPEAFKYNFDWTPKWPSWREGFRSAVVRT